MAEKFKTNSIMENIIDLLVLYIKVLGDDRMTLTFVKFCWKINCIQPIFIDFIGSNKS